MTNHDLILDCVKVTAILSWSAVVMLAGARLRHAIMQWRKFRKRVVSIQERTMKIWAKTKEFSEGKFLVVRRDGSVPHWPHFVIGARDPAATAGLLAYAECYQIDRY